MERVKGVPAGADTVEYAVNVNGEEKTVVLNKPNEQQVFLAFQRWAAKPLEGFDTAGAGKLIWEMCAVDWDKEVREDPRRFIQVCMTLATDYVIPSDEEVKKK